MSGESSKRSDLIDVTYQNLHFILSGRAEGTSLAQIADILRPRIPQLRNIREPFGTPNDASKKKVDSGSVALRDGVILRVEDADKEYVFAVSRKFGIDEVDALVLLRSLFYNEGLSSKIGADPDSNMVDELLERITPFYHAERLAMLRVLEPLFRANENPDDPLYAIASEFLPQIVPDGTAFAETLITEYDRRTKAPLPEGANTDPRQASAWAKQNAKEQLVMLEVLFWTMFSYAPCAGPLVVRIFETAYDTGLGSRQQNSTLLLDEEGVQLQQDSAALWILITIEVLELERVAEPGGIEIAADPADKNIYWASPESLKRIHELVVSHGDSHYACTFVAWAYVLSRLAQVIGQMKEVPESYAKFFESLLPQLDRSYSKDREATHILMAKTALDPDVGLFNLILTLLTGSPLFVTSVALRTGSSVTDPNAVAFRSVLKGLVMSIVELVPVELIPDFDTLVEVWIALFGRSESQPVAGICKQFWTSDWSLGIARRAILDVARSRFHIQPRPLIRLLRALTAAGFLETDPLSPADYSQDLGALSEDRMVCAEHVFVYLNSLPTYTQVVHVSQCTGAHAPYDKVPDRNGSSGLVYINLRPIKLPGGSILAPKSVGQLLSGDGSDLVVVCWQHQHSGWKVLLELLTDYVNRTRLQSGTSGSRMSTAPGQRGGHSLVTLRLEDIGVEMDPASYEAVITDILDLIRSVVQDNPSLAERLLKSLESGDPVVSHTAKEAQPPDLVQLTTMILEGALAQPERQRRGSPKTALITSAMSVLAALLPLPKYSPRVWLYIRSTTSLFGSDKAVGVVSSVLAAERLTGHYTMTLALLHLVQQLFDEASSSVIMVMQHNPKLQPVKEEVLLRAARFVHSEIWVEHMGWKYAQLGDRFEIGRRVSSFYSQLLKQASPTLKDGPFTSLSRAIVDALLFKASTSTVNPLVSAVTNAGAMFKLLSASRRYTDARRLIFLLQCHLILIRVLLTFKQKSPISDKSCLLEQMLCASVGGNVSSFDGAPARTDPVDALAGFVKQRDMGDNVRVEAMRVLFALCSSLSVSQDSPPTIIGHLSDPEATVSSLVRVIQHPYDDALLRNAVWNFIILAVDKEPALARLFVTGRFRVQEPQVSEKGKGKEKATDQPDKPKAPGAFVIACEMLAEWRQFWEVNPQLLASLVRFLDVVWQHGHEHKASLEDARKTFGVFEHLAAILREELGPAPDYRTEEFVTLDGVQRSNLHEPVSSYAYRATLKSHTAHIIATDIKMHLESVKGDPRSQKPASYTALEDMFKAEEDLSELVAEAASSVYDPALYDELIAQVNAVFPALKMEQLQMQELIVERDFGDDFAFSKTLLQLRLQPFVTSGYDGIMHEALKKLTSINLNLSLAHVQTALTQSWQALLLQTVPYLRSNSIRPVFLSMAASISGDLSMEKRSGDMMSAIHSARLSLLLSLLEVAWFSAIDKGAEIDNFIRLVQNVRGILLNNALPPAKSFLGQYTAPFHRPLLQIIYFCARHSRSLARRPKVLNAEQRLAISALLDTTLILTIDALRMTFDSARVRLDLELDQDLELLVAVFEQCTRPDLNPSPTLWLTRCQETDVIRASLQLFSGMDLVGLSDTALLRTRKQPLYAPQVLTFHMALASIPAAAERLASGGILAAYSENPLSSAARAGMIDVILPELPGERSPAHFAYCTMLAIIAGVVTALGQHSHYFDEEASGLIQFYGDQIHRAMSWTIGEPITLPLLEEMEQIVNLFSAMAHDHTHASGSEAVKSVLQFFTSDALLLLQQLNYALTHPNHLASLIEPITAEEKSAMDADQDKSSVTTPSEVVDPVKRPFLARIVHRLFRLSASILSTLVTISRAETVLIGEPEDWPIDQALIVPHSKVVPGEPASLGTLLELGNCSLDVLRRLVDRPAAQAVVKGVKTEKALDVHDIVATTRLNLEAAVLYAVTQLAMWLSKPEFDATPNEMDLDDALAESQAPESVKERRARRQSSMSLAERLRRGMTGEMAADLQSLLNKAKPIVAKSETVMGEKDVDILQVLSQFVHERISVPS
ncbi:hypothetical protein OBBRIDRAFT_123418 [Obba rivulosa]|uniref:Nucleoporin subcomplex protein binding to Pom34-domain-containing protein n=1 Tax=Obba rivulosa TaxID=1052685 RepID=A0A8E2J4B8_9APHY|nr:hypothetical protein OBBRIDRAFT_123418 [Obba rivulosa]